jgi:cellobiose-specific phosphotransferase system component IIB
MTKKLVAVTACPTGIARRYMAAESLSKAAQAKGIEIKVETRGSVGVENELSEADLRLWHPRGNPLRYIVAIAIGTVVTAILVNALKQPAQQ